MICRKNNAFNLMDLMVVIAIVGVLLALSVPAVNSVLRASSLSTSGQMLVDQLNLARQTAISRNLPVEVRLYRLPGINEPSSATPSEYRAMQSFLVTDAGSEPLNKVQTLTPPALMLSDANKSSLLGNALTVEVPGASAIPNFGTNYSYRSFYFKPNGATNYPNADLFVTLALQNQPDLSKRVNYFVVQIDAVTGRPRVLRP